MAKEQRSSGALYVETEGGGMERLEKPPSKPPRVKMGPKVKSQEAKSKPETGDAD